MAAPFGKPGVPALLTEPTIAVVELMALSKKLKAALLAWVRLRAPFTWAERVWACVVSWLSHDLTDVHTLFAQASGATEAAVVDVFELEAEVPPPPHAATVHVKANPAAEAAIARLTSA
jgi:hypothetical protein